MSRTILLLRTTERLGVAAAGARLADGRRTAGPALTMTGGLEGDVVVEGPSTTAVLAFLRRAFDEVRRAEAHRSQDHTGQLRRSVDEHVDPELHRLRAELDAVLGGDPRRFTGDADRIAEVQSRLAPPGGPITALDEMAAEIAETLCRRTVQLDRSPTVDSALSRLDGLIMQCRDDADLYRELGDVIMKQMPVPDEWSSEDGWDSEFAILVATVTHLARWAAAANDGAVPPRSAAPAERDEPAGSDKPARRAQLQAGETGEVLYAQP